MKIFRLLSAGIIATSLASGAHASAIYSFNSGDYDPFTAVDDSFSVNFTSAGATFYILSYGFSGGVQAGPQNTDGTYDGASVAGGGVDSTFSILGTDFESVNAFADPGCIGLALGFGNDAGAPVAHSGGPEGQDDTADDCLEIQVGVEEGELAANQNYTLELTSSFFGLGNGSWAFDILGVEFASTDPISEVPAPGLIGLFGLMLAGVSARRAKRLAAR